MDGHSPNEQSIEKSEQGSRLMEISDQTVEFHTVETHHHAVTAAQVAEAAHKHPADDFTVLRRTDTLELELVSAVDPVPLHRDRPNQFFVIRGTVLYRFVADDLNFEWPEDVIDAQVIRRLLNKDEPDIEVIVRDRHGERVLGDHDEVRLSEPGLERFFTRHVHRQIEIIVDGEPYPPPRREMTPNEIILLGAEKDPTQYYLVRIKPHESYKDKGDIPIHLHNGESFQAILIGPTPVSDSQVRTGIAVFVEGLRALGYEPALVAEEPNCVVIDYVVPSGKLVGQAVKHGFIVPADFPITPPSGPHVSPAIHPFNQNGSHPTGGVHTAQSEPFNRRLAGGWQYWSRPFPGWPKSKRSVAAYMNYIGQLWETQ